MDSPVETMYSSPVEARPFIEARSLNIGYSGELVVADINFALRPGQALGLIGTNGCGKTTLLKTIVGLLPLLKGQLMVLGMPPGKNRSRIAYLGQFHSSGFVLPIRVVDVVRMGRFPLRGLLQRMNRQDDEIVLSAMQTMGIQKLADSPLRSLSGGQQQRAYLAQVLAHQADLLVLDEPATGLDAGGRELYLTAIKQELSRGVAIVIATHDIKEEASLCHQVMLMARRVVAVGPPREVLTPEALLNTFGIAITGDKSFQIIETHHGHDDHTSHTTKKDYH
jgi:ABC-type Mn2+/Zn2+ transport system ATPase subunit